MSIAVIVDCTEIFPSNERSTDLDRIILSRASDTVNILHLWCKHGINISYRRRQHIISSVQIWCFIGQTSKRWRGFLGQQVWVNEKLGIDN